MGPDRLLARDDRTRQSARHQRRDHEEGGSENHSQHDRCAIGDEFAKKIVDAGGKVVRAKTAIPGIGWFAYCVDTEGNVFGIMQSDPKAS